MRAFRVPVPVLAIGALCASGLAAQEPVEPPFSYVLTAEMNGAPGGEWTVIQGPEIAVARWSDEEGVGDVALVAGPAVGGPPAEPMEQVGGLLSVLFGPAADFGPGYRRASQYGTGTAIVDSVRFELQQGTDDERIAGHETLHHVLTTRIWWRHRAEDGSETPVVDSGTADLWFAPDLPFSWLPLAVHPVRPGLALPLSFWWPEAVEAAVDRYGGRFEELGLLMRARTSDETRPPEDPDGEVQLVGIELQSSVSVSELKDAEQAPESASYAELPRISRSRILSLRMAGFVLDPCRFLESPAGGTFRFSTSGPRAYRADGAGAVFVIEDEIENAHVLVAGGAGDEGLQCTLILLPGDTPRAGTFPVVAPRPDLVEDDGDYAIGLHAATGGREIGRMFVMERGEVRIEEAGDGGIRGRLEGEAWGLEARPGLPPEQIEALAVELTFDAVPAETP